MEWRTVASMLVGRYDERKRIDRLLDEGAAGRGGALVVRGEAGIGKTALLEYARGRAQAATAVSTTGVESEVELPFAGLADVLRPLLGCLSKLPGSQADVVRAALGLGPPRPIDRLGVGAATLALLAAAAEDVPLLVLVDDAQWLDAASRDALVFAARRLASDPVVVILAARDGEPLPFDPSDIETLVLVGLARDDAAALLGSAVPPAALDTLIELTHGNPLALVELPATLSEAQLLRRQPLEHPLRVGAGIERAFARRALVLGERVGRALLVAAADDSGLVEVVEESARRVGAGPDELRQAEDAGLLRVDGPRIEFCHPLVRAAVYQGAAPTERRDAHHALAAVLQGRDETRRAWHAAAAAVGHDSATADALAAVATESSERGAYATAAAAFERSARLTPDGDQRPIRLARAADAAWLAGQTAHAAALVNDGLSANPTYAARAELLALRGRMALYGDDQEAAYDTLLEAARLVEATDPTRASEFLSDAIDAAIQLGGSAAKEAAARLGALAANGDAVRELLVAQALLTASSVAGELGAERRLAQAVVTAERAGALDTSALHLFWAGRGRWMLAHNDDAARLARRALDRARQDAALAVIPQALRLLAMAEFDRGRWRAAYAAASEAAELALELEQRATACACLGLLADVDAATGDEEACRAHAAAAIAIARATSLGYYRERAERALGRLELARGRLAEAIERFEQVQQRLNRTGNWEPNVTPAWDLVEAYVRVGEPEKARALLERAEGAMPPVSASEEANIERCHGIVGDEESFEAAFERALACHRAEPFPFEQARTAPRLR